MEHRPGLHWGCRNPRLLSWSRLNATRSLVARTQLPSICEENGERRRGASKLAYLIGVPVPPVGFWHDLKANSYALSIRAFHESVHWGDALFIDADREALITIFSASAVFHTRIADANHDGHLQNVVVDPNSPAGAPEVAFIDHAMSLGAAWHSGLPIACRRKVEMSPGAQSRNDTLGGPTPRETASQPSAG
jgi:hypothetical protein